MPGSYKYVPPQGKAVVRSDWLFEDSAELANVGGGIKYGGRGVVKSVQVIQNVQLAGGVFALAKKLGIERAEGESILIFSQRVEKEATERQASEGLEKKGSESAGPALDEKYWSERKAPTQVEPGTKQITEMKPSSRKKGEVYERSTFYDEYGRSEGQSHPTDHGEPDIHPNPHHHLRDPKRVSQKFRCNVLKCPA
jgi:hypothetical protein